MAALEKIRKRAVLLTVVIGVALLAFILGDLINSGQAFFGDGNTIVKVGDEKIDAMEFQKRYETISAQYQNSGNTVTDGALLQKNVIEGMISEILLDKEIEEVGIYVTETELTDAMTGKGASQEMVQYAQQRGCESPAQLYDLLFNPAKYGATEQQVAEAKAEWLQLEKEMERMLKQAKLQALIVGAIQANDLDKKSLFEENAVTSQIAYAKADYSSLKDADYEVTDADLKAEYNGKKNMFKLEEEQRVGHVIAVDVVPSAEDLATAKTMIDTTLAVLRSGEGVDGVRHNSELVIEEGTVRLNDIRDTQIKAFVEKAKVGDVSEPKFVSNLYTIAKLNGKKLEVDSVNVNMVTVQGDKKVQDSIMNALNSGKAFAEVVNNKTVGGQEDVWQVLMNVADSVKTKVLNAGAGYFPLSSNDQMAYLVKVNKKVAPKNMYDVAFITHKVIPSVKTVNDLRDNLQAFINENNTSELLESKAVAAGYQPMPVVAYSSSPQVNGIANSRKAVQWMFGADKGAVSPIFDKENKDKMIVVALDDIYEEGFLPMNEPQVKSMLTQVARNSKKGDALVEKYNGKANDLEGYAQLMNCKVDTAQVTFGQPFIPGLGMGENILTAAVTAAKENELNGVLKGSNAVYVYKVIKHDRTERTPGAEVERQFARTRGNSAVMQNADAILRKAAKVENNMIKFF
ncbi:MAG: SurA N-terminal domain-containing protein [Muribaculaceae bacterium]|nr:SurA N-terminal domain-containing protein [Muribaculaceae bacterium]